MITKDYTDLRVLVTGSSGFLGSHLVGILRDRGYSDIVTPISSDYDLTVQSQVQQMYADTQPQVVVHLAAVVGGIAANRDNPGSFYYKNMSMGLHMIEEARLHNVQKFVAIGTICAYPKYAPIPFNEHNLWDGYPEETNAPYGLAKKMMLVQSQAYRQQYGFNSIYLLPVNLYGPRDNFDLYSSHVIPALIRKMLEAKENRAGHVTLWGSGAASREFLYVEDAADGIIQAMVKYDGNMPLNLGVGQEIPIHELANIIKELCGYHGDIIWDTSQPDGQPRRCLDTGLAQIELGWSAQTQLKDGLRKTISWYLENR